MSSGQKISCCRRVCGRGVEWSCSSVRSTLDAPDPQENKDLMKMRMDRIIRLEDCFSVNT